VGLARFPALARATRDAWLGAIRRFVEADLPVLHAAGAAAFAAERELRLRFPLGAREVDLTGRFDRVVGHANGRERIGDYKTSRGDVKNLASVTSAATGEHLQLAIYALARERETGATPDAEILRVRPDPAESARREPRSDREAIDLADFLDRRGEIEKTLAVLGELEHAGLHPLTLDDDRCERCAYRRACRVQHPPTFARVAAASVFAEYHARVALKTRKRPKKSAGGAPGAAGADDSCGSSAETPS
jgi:RecB family exonuclease